MWPDHLLKKLSIDTCYSRKDLYRIFLEEKADLSESSFKWILYNLLRNKALFRAGFDEYTLCRPEQLPVYNPIYSDKAGNLIQILSSRFPKMEFVVSEASLLNEFLNHQIANNTIFIQMEKDASLFIFDILKYEYDEKILYKPNAKEFDIYWSPDCIIILDLISQAPLSHDSPHKILLEKMLVDIIAEKSIAAIFSQSELPDLFTSAMENYQIDKRKLTRYAGRRGKSAEIKKYAGGVL